MRKLLYFVGGLACAVGVWNVKAFFFDDLWIEWWQGWRGVSFWLEDLGYARLASYCPVIYLRLPDWAIAMGGIAKSCV